MKLNDQQLEYVITSVREHEAHEAADRLMEHIAALEAELARLTPSGQVAEDVEALVQAIWGLDGRRLQAMNPAQAKDAIAEIVRASRLAAKAQGYEAIRKALSDNYGTDGDPLERVKDLLESEEAARNEAAVEQAERHRVEGERDAAVADNAALLQALLDVTEMRLSWPTLAAMATKLKTEPHPGAALLERVKMLEADERKASLEAAAIGLALSGLFEFPDSQQVRAQAREVCESQEAGKDFMERMKRLEGAATKAAAELRHTYGHVSLGQSINPDRVARAIRILEEASR